MLYLAKGVRGANGKTFNVFGELIPNSLTSDFYAAGLTVPYSPIDPTSFFDVSSLMENREVVVAIYDISATITSRVDFTFNWYRKRDNLKIFSYSSYLSSPPAGTEYSGLGATGWIGWLSYWDQGVWTYPELKEIQENGDYYVEFTASGGYSDFVRADFTVTGIPSDWHIWEDTIANYGFDFVIRFSTRFQTSNYIRAGLCTSNFTNGQTAAPNGIISETVQFAPSGEGHGCAIDGYVNTLKSGTTYTLYAFAQAANGQYYKIGSRTVTTKGTSVPSSPPQGDKIEGGFDLTWGSSPGATSYTVKIRRAYDNFTTYKTFYTNSGRVTDLQYGVTYYLSVSASSYTGSSDYTEEVPATTAPRTPDVSLTTVTNSSISINAYFIYSTNFDEIQVERYTSNSVYIDTKFISKADFEAGNRTVTWSGLTQGSTYIFKARSKFTVNSTVIYSANYSNNLTVTVTSLEEWRWTTACDVSGKKIRGVPFRIDAAEWRQFTQRINSFRDYRKVGVVSFTYVVQGEEVKASYFNEAKNAIGSVIPTGIADKKGKSTYPSNPDQITAADLNTLMEKLNDFI